MVSLPGFVIEKDATAGAVLNIVTARTLLEILGYNGAKPIN
jgi:hypothetical protein